MSSSDSLKSIAAYTGRQGEPRPEYDVFPRQERARSLCGKMAMVD